MKTNWRRTGSGRHQITCKSVRWPVCFEVSHTKPHGATGRWIEVRTKQAQRTVVDDCGRKKEQCQNKPCSDAWSQPFFFRTLDFFFFRPQDVCQAPLGAAWALPLSPFDYISGVVPLFSWRGDFSTKSLIFFFFILKLLSIHSSTTFSCN